MRTPPLRCASLLIAGLVLAGCASKTTSPAQYSGFLSSYEGLQSTRTASGATVLRWVDPGFEIARYSHVIYQPVRFHPEPHASERISQQTLQALLDYTNQRLSAAAFSRLQPAAVAAGPGTLAFRGAVTGVQTSTQGLKPYEVVPVALLMAGAMTAAGERDQNSELYLEAELIDTASGRPVLRVVRKGLGRALSNDKQALSLDDFKPVIDELTEDLLRFQ